MTEEGTEIRRVTRSKAEAQATYDRISRWYNLLEGMWEKRARDLGLRKLDVRDGEQVLEIGFGPGGRSIPALRNTRCNPGVDIWTTGGGHSCQPSGLN